MCGTICRVLPDRWGRSGGVSVSFPGACHAIVAAVAAAGLAAGTADAAAPFADAGGVPGLPGWPQDFALRLALYLTISLTLAALISRAILYGIRLYTKVSDRYVMLGLAPIVFGLALFGVTELANRLLAWLQSGHTAQVLLPTLIFLLTWPLIVGFCLLYDFMIACSFFARAPISKYIYIVLGSIVIFIEVLYLLYVTNIVE
jgi:hypothetical protein